MKQLFVNNAKTTLASQLGISDTALVVADGSKFPNPGLNQYFLVTVELGTQIEILMITARSGNTFTIGGLVDVGNTVAGRGQEGTSAQSFASGAKVECRVTRATLDRMSKGLASISAITSMVSPAASFNDGYVIGTLDPAGNPIVAVAKDTNTWRFLNFTSQFTGTATAGTTTTVTAASVPITDVGPNKYIIQFTSGLSVGMLRSVISIGGGVVSWSGATTNAIAVGDTFELLKANTSIISDALANLTFPIANNTGTGDALIAAYTSAATTLTDNVTVLVAMNDGTTNATTTPTFAPNGLTPKTIKTNSGSALPIGQLTGTIMLRYESSTDDWRLVGVQQSIVAQPINYFLGNF